MHINDLKEDIIENNADWSERKNPSRVIRVAVPKGTSVGRLLIFYL